ncbi:hypothetical protein swp_1744 [Shewanella piezotolerans WP3]|uniref:Uncharacterized protein n=1 Tax=Shewanella piezotolerans (strain WP3 / JCM 13877) TaxID=225849 RepID=B8CN11_SHEPW|nr:hypothetical protein swp_1744 [Shewanella piezotolerans WP3]
MAPYIEGCVKTFKLIPLLFVLEYHFLTVFEINVKKISAYLKTNISLLVIKQVLVVHFDANTLFLEKKPALFSL